MADLKPSLVIMAREPVMGRVKTRLARAVGAAEALRFYRANLAGQVKELASPRWRTILAVTPDNAHVGALPIGRLDLVVVPQGPGDLGARMQRQFDLLPPGPVVVVGSDIPGIRRADIERAFRLLGACDAVIGPSPDGGYWLIGLKRFPRIQQIFGGVRMSSDQAYADTRSRLAGLSVGEMRMLEDVDDLPAFRRWRRAFG
ncbi:MAG: TIGR04282 family arsenosugar biosynthesis glycosyltransferase [Rhodobiaceae bacterium]|nr:TIGR04282 family arsenosugar biosynthesis glycosyltransferase [Rhodobiaceae bacterium]MCC0054815.1 TIGR04282 family arsenosugar biosynthesis glycosyltransferase [Rhodobiaceae bacterium]